MQLAGYSYTWGPITQPREIDYAKLFQWYRDRDIRTIELYDPWIEDKGEDHVQMIVDTLAAYEMDPRLCDVNCHVVSRDAAERKAGGDRFRDRLQVMNRIGVKIALILPSLPDYETSGTICTTTAASKDVAFRLDLTTNKRVLATTDGSSFDTVLHLHTGMCATGEEEACDDDGGELSASRLDRVLAPGTHYFIVDGWGATRAGDYLFEVVVSDP